MTISNLDPEKFAVNHPSLWNKLLDPTKCQVHSIDMPPCRKQKVKGKRGVKSLIARLTFQEGPTYA